MIDAIAFDLDGTLIDRKRAAARYWRAVVEQYPDIADDELEGFIGLDTGEPGCGAQIRRYLVDSGLSAYRPGLVQYINYTFPTRIVDHLAADPGVRPMLERLARRYKLALITNGRSQTQRRKIAAAGLAELMDCVVISGAVGLAKPDPAIFRLAAQRLGVEPGRVMMVGDDLKRDILGAASAGMQTAWVRPDKQAKPNAAIGLNLSTVLELERAFL